MISVAISSKDYIASLRLHRKRTVTRQILVFSALCAAAVIAIALGHMMVGIMLIAGCIGGLVGELVQSKILLPRRAKKIYTQQASLRATYNYSWDKEGLSVSSEIGQAKRPWSDYIKFVENDQLILLYHSDIVFEIFSKSWFPNQEQADDFRKLASRVGT